MTELKIFESDKLTMSSREIAAETGKRHDHVIRDCEVLNESYENLHLPKIGEMFSIRKLPNGGSTKDKYFELTQMQVWDLMTGYSTELRIKVNRRWAELEKAYRDHTLVLKAYLLDQATEWEKTFGDDYYEQLCRLWNQEIGTKPQFFGHLTNKYIYEVLPDGVLESLKENTPNGIRLHQTLTPEVGKKHLRIVLEKVTMLMKLSENKIEFEDMFERYFKNKPRQYNFLDNY